MERGTFTIDDGAGDALSIEDTLVTESNMQRAWVFNHGTLPTAHAVAITVTVSACHVLTRVDAVGGRVIHTHACVLGGVQCRVVAGIGAHPVGDGNTGETESGEE